MKSFEVAGEWWLPDDVANSKAGTLSFSPEKGLSLELIGSFASLEDLTAQILPTYPIIFGFTPDSNSITLVNCMTVFLHFGTGLPTQRIYCHMAYIGHRHIEREAKFLEIEVEYSYLIDWIGLSGFHEEQIFENGKPVGFDLKFRLPDPIHASVSDTMITLGYGLATNPTLRNVNYSQRAVVRIQRPTALSIDQWLSDYVSPIQDLMSLATDHPNATTELAVFVKFENPEEGEQRNEMLSHLPIQVVFQPVFHQDSKPKRLLEHDMLFSFADLETDFSEFLTKWFEIANTLDTVCSLYLNTRYNPAKYLESRFLNVAQAVELYHRLRSKSTDLPKQEFKKRVRLIVGSAPTEYQPWLKEQLRFSNEPRLSKRIAELYDLTKDVMKQLYPDKDAFVTKVKDSRNYYTHYSSDKKKAAQGIELYRLVEILSYMLIRGLLHDLGFSSKRCIELLNRNQRFLQFKREMSQFGPQSTK